MPEGSAEGALAQPKQKTGRQSIGNIPLGASRESRTPALSALQEQGVLVPGTTVSRLKSGHTTGIKIEERLLANKVLETNNVSGKDSLYAEIARKGLEIRQSQKPPNSLRWLYARPCALP